MDAVIRIGGSLAEKPKVLRALCKTLSGIAERHKILVVPGGGRFADAVRDVDRVYALSAKLSHRMAIIGMDQFGLLLSEIIPNSTVTDSLHEATSPLKTGTVSIFLPSKLFSHEEPLEPSWDVTSDSIAAYVADRVHANRLLLVTDVDGIFTADPKNDSGAKLIREFNATDLLKMEKRTSVDLFLPKLLLEKRLNCYVVNGVYPKRIEAILEGETAICTYLAPK